MQVQIVVHSGYGHTQRVAEHVKKGIAKHVEAGIISIDPNGDIKESDWANLLNAKMIVFGTPTYMGSCSWQFKKFADASSKPWFTSAWKNKFAAGFTNSATMNGDKLSTLHYLFTLSQQHGMVWIGTGMMPANKKSATRNDLNYVGSFAGLMTTTPADASVEEIPEGDLATATAFGERLGEFVKTQK